MTGIEKTANDFLDFLQEKNIEGIRGIWHENGVLEYPFAPYGAFSIEGREAIIEKLKYAFTYKTISHFDHKATYLMQDGKHVFLEFDGHLTNESGTSYTNNYCALVEFENEQIILFREYYNALIRQQYDKQ